MLARTLYNHLKSSADIPIRCPICSERMTVNHFYQRHALENHRLQSRKQCVFCKGLKSWAHGEKNRPDNVKHVVKCLKRFVIVARDESPGMEDETEEEEEEEEVTSAEVCECKKFESTPHQMLGRRKERMNEYVGFYDSVFENPDWWRCDDPVEFTEASGLGKDVYGILQRFTRGDLVWFHLMVKHDAFETFCKEMGKIRGQFALLSFWCLFDGMVSGTGRTQHRHMIVACELESAFKDIWQYKIRYDFPNSGRAKKCVKIQDAFHLARAIVYVSQRKAGCDGRIPTDLTEAGPLSHFHMNRPLHEHSIAFLCTLFPGGIQKLLLEQNRNKDVVRWESESVCLTEEHTAQYLTLHGGQKLYLKRENGEQDVNWSFQSIRDELFVLSQKQQNVMNQIKETKMAQEAVWKCKVAEGRAERDVLKMEKDVLKTKETELKTERDAIKTERDVIKTERDVIKTERDGLLTENARLRRALRDLAQMISDVITRFLTIGGFVLDIERRLEGPVQPALPRREGGTIGHVSLLLLLRTRGRQKPRGGNVGRRRSRELCASPLDRVYEARLVPKSRQGLALVWTAGCESMADVGTNGDGLFVQRSLAGRRVWRARDVSHLLTRDAPARENPLWARVSRKMFETGPDHESDVPLVQTTVHRVSKIWTPNVGKECVSDFLSLTHSFPTFGVPPRANVGREHNKYYRE
ncbi:uncharacterized protein NPIL_605461 [Nephila pilipes]|uniref:Uncharacterized protein n=1 Tax=Nephila pilipes TaxID=299642 RepID=A0A8X6PDY2_NEPPI|nr:uncharacterized protein NPIL_286581 [Nephila pilipes]GFU25557.1 uncharacterized protein NPIL_605461 [Nephila pilipes]